MKYFILIYCLLFFLSNARGESAPVIWHGSYAQFLTTGLSIANIYEPTGTAAALQLGLSSSGNYGNVGVGSAVSASPNFPLLIQRTLAGDMVNVEISNPTTDPQGGAAYWLLTDNGDASFIMQIRNTESVAPDAYAGGGGILRTSGTTPALTLVADDVVTAKIKFYVAGNDSAHKSAQINADQTLESFGGVRLSTTVARPTCAVGIRGTMWIVQGAPSAADELFACMKKADDTYAWVSVKAAP